MEYKNRLIETYYSSHYQYILPQTIEGWNWVIDRIKLNFDDIFLSIPKNSLIIDLGCGVGYLEYYLLMKDFTHIEAIDLSNEQIKVAKKKLSEFGLHIDNVKFKTEDAFAYLKSVNNVDIIVMIDFIEHFQKEEAMELLQLSSQALNKGGLLIIRTINADNPAFAHLFYRDFTHETPFTTFSLRQCLNVSGFNVLKIGYEVVPKVHKSRFDLISYLKQETRWMGLWFLGKLLGVSVDAFSEDLIAVGRKQ